MSENKSGFEGLLQDVTTPTEPKALQPPPVTVIEAVIESKPESAATTSPPAVQASNDTLDATKIIDPDKIRTETDFALSMLDMAQTTVFTLGAKYKRKSKLEKFGEGTSERAETLEQKPKEDLTPEEKAILKIEQQVREEIEKIPFTESEKEQLHKIVAEYIRKNHGQIPEKFFEYLILLQIFGGRFLNILML